MNNRICILTTAAAHNLQVSSPEQATPRPVQFYRLSHLKQLLGVSGSTIWNWVNTQWVVLRTTSKILS
ncbi:MAG TPA: hypothetical protein VIU93_08895 [Gallionellaceae bacterium]